jgi:hypothetical protein
LAISQLDREMQNKPFLQVGFGVNQYFDILVQSLVMMILISLFCIPVYILYAKGEVYSDSYNPFLRITIGNMQGATT